MHARERERIEAIRRVAEAVAMARKGIPYSRFSGKRQEAGESQDRQDRLAEQAAREEGVQLDRTITLSDRGVSAFRGDNWKRGDLGKFLDLVDAGLIPKGSVLIIEQVNRLSRMPWMDQVELWKEILSRDIVIRTCVPPSRYTKANMNELAVGCPVVLLMMLAHQDSVQKSGWVRDAWAQKKKRAAAEGVPHGQRCPKWVRAATMPHPKNPARIVTVGYELIPERVAVLRQIFEWSAAQWGAWRIARQLNLDGVRPWGPAACWAQSTVKHLLRSRTVLGEYQPWDRQPDGTDVARSPIPDYYPPAIPEDLWLRAQAAQRRRRKKGGRPGVDGNETNLFTHLVFEATTRRPMQCCSCVNDGKQYHYMHTNPRTDGFAYAPFEDAILDAVGRLKARDVDGRHKADAYTARVDRLQEERAELGLELDALDAQLRELPVKKWPKRVVARMSELEEQIGRLDEELRLAKEAADTSGRTEALTELQTVVQLLHKVRGTPREAGVRQRIKARLPLIIEEIWVRVQRVSKAARYVHIRLYLVGDEQRPFVKPVVSKGGLGARPWKLLQCDFRAGEVGRDAVDAEPAAQATTGSLAG